PSPLRPAARPGLSLRRRGPRSSLHRQRRGRQVNAAEERVARLSTSPSARAEEAQSEQQDTRSDCCVADETKSVSSDNLAREPSGNDPDDQNDNESLVRQMHALTLRSDSRPVGYIAVDWGGEQNRALAGSVGSHGEAREQGKHRKKSADNRQRSRPGATAVDCRWRGK